mmetsp:Transcript_16759/g.63461  ORF Transcript_16759/g.63461 Transcript_16759/m.63461 type:complete len:215 (-) Transcript_16759:735-1379(-)
MHSRCVSSSTTSPHGSACSSTSNGRRLGTPPASLATVALCSACTGRSGSSTTPCSASTCAHTPELSVACRPAPTLSSSASVAGPSHGKPSGSLSPRTLRYLCRVNTPPMGRRQLSDKCSPAASSSATPSSSAHTCAVTPPSPDPTRRVLPPTACREKPCTRYTRSGRPAASRTVTSTHDASGTVSSRAASASWRCVSMASSCLAALSAITEEPL